MNRRKFLASAAAGATLPVFLGDRVYAASAPPAALAAVRLDGQSITLQGSDLEDFRRSLRGPLLLPSAPDYDAVRQVWNAAIDRHPALIARCLGSADVSVALKFAAAHDLLVAVRGGGHSTSGASVCEGGLMLDLSLMRGVLVDPKLDSARAEAGVLLGALDREALAFGRVTTTGMVSHTGAAGLTLGGGCGRLARRFGLAVDNVAGVDIVTPDGVLRTASATENPDLYWAVRGGSGNFGVVTSFEYRLHPFDVGVFGGTIDFDFKHARNVLRHFAGYIADAPDDLWIAASIGDAEVSDRTLTFDVCYSGPAAKAEKILEPLRRHSKPRRDSIGPIPYTTLQTSLDHEGRHGLKRYQTSGYLMKIDDALIETALSLFEKPDDVPFRLLIMPWGGGSIARVPRDATAYWHRDIRWNINVATTWTEASHAEARTERVKSAWKKIQPLTHGFYANSITGRDASAMTGTYGGNYERLAVIKKKYDPQNRLRLNANVLPAA